MIKIQWNDQEIKWFHNASEYTDYNTKLANLILCHAKVGGTLCDIGCGAGLVDLIMAPHFEHITCVDIGEKAIESIQNDVKEMEISNITALCQRGETLQGQWDNVITIFHGSSDVFQKYFQYATDRMIIISHDKKSERFGHKDKHNHFYNASGTKEALDKMGIKYDMINTEIEHGQPFVDLEDAKNFFEHYVKFDTEEETLKYMKEHLVETGDAKYPYYQPKKKKFGMFVIRRSQNEGFE